MISVKTSPGLLEHLSTYEVDGATVVSGLFGGGRLSYPGRADIEYQLAYVDPYTLAHEARVIEGLPSVTATSIKFLAGVATEAHRGEDLTLDLLWGSHGAYGNRREGPSLDRLVAALVTIHDFREASLGPDDPDGRLRIIFRASEQVVRSFHGVGLPLTRDGLEELFDGADPACLGLGLVELA